MKLSQKVKVFMGAMMLTLSVTAYPETMSVQSFEQDRLDQTATLSGTTVKDINGKKCALIKVITNERGFTFDTGMLAPMKIEEKPGEIWVYVPSGVKNITISHPLLESIRDYSLGQSLKPGRTYVLRLTSDRVITNTIDYNHRQRVRIHVNAPHAQVSINGILSKTDASGNVDIDMYFGTHRFTVTAPDYREYDGEVTVNDPDKPQEVNIELTPAFGYLTIAEDPAIHDATLLIDGQVVGKLPMEHIKVMSGPHKVTIVPELFTPYSENITMSDAGQLSLVPFFSPNSAGVHIRVPDREATIVVDGIERGVGSWSGRLGAGNHTIEARRQDYYPTSMSVTVERDRNTTFDLEPPTPITGALSVTSSPLGAQVYIDGKKAGTTPLNLNDIPIGTHTVTVKCNGYFDAEQECRVTENNTTPVIFSMNNSCRLDIDSKARFGRVYIDDEYVGMVPYSGTYSYGKANVRVTADGYTQYSRTVSLNRPEVRVNARQYKILVRRDEFYVDASYLQSKNSAISAGMGGYISRFNIEGSYQYYLKEQGPVYWQKNSNEATQQRQYRPRSLSARVGWGLRIGTRLRLTPQVGCTYTELAEREDGGKPSFSIANGANALSVSAGVKLNIALCNGVALTVNPEYQLRVNESDGFKAIAERIDAIDNLGKGPQLRAGILLFISGN